MKKQVPFFEFVAFPLKFLLRFYRMVSIGKCKLSLFTSKFKHNWFSNAGQTTEEICIYEPVSKNEKTKTCNNLGLQFLSF